MSWNFVNALNDLSYSKNIEGVSLGEGDVPHIELLLRQQLRCWQNCEANPVQPTSWFERLRLHRHNSEKGMQQRLTIEAQLHVLCEREGGQSALARIVSQMSDHNPQKTHLIYHFLLNINESTAPA